MANWLKTVFVNLWRQPTRPQNLTFDKYLPYFGGNGYADDFPLQWHKAISESPSATACVSTIQDFLEGFGFSDTALEKKVVNSRGETLFQIHQKTSKDFGEFQGFWWHFMFDATGKITEWRVLPFESMRLGKPDSKGYIGKVVYNPYFGTKDFTTLKDDETCWYHVWNPAAVKQQILLEGAVYKGQVLFVGTTDAMSRFYPLPEAHSGIKWMVTEANVAKYHESHVKNGYLKNFMLIMKGDPSQPSNNPDYQSVPEGKRITVGQEFDEQVGENFMGPENQANMWVQWVANGEEKPEIVEFPSNGTGEQLLNTDATATKKITVAFKVPSILANINEGVSLGGDGNMIRVAVKLMQQRVIKKQRLLTDTYSAVLKNFSSPYTQDITIVPYNPYPELEVIDQKIWDSMTEPERRQWIQDNTEIELFDDDVLAEPGVSAQPTQAKLLNAVPVPFPENIRNSIQKALDYQIKMGLKCGGSRGRQLSMDIVNNSNLGIRALKRLHNYLKKNEQYSNSAFTDGCSAIQYAAWGGKEMKDFLEGELKRLDAWLN